MSYDVSLHIFTGKSEHEVVDCGNYTSNVSKMYYETIEGGLPSLNNTKAYQAATTLSLALTRLKSDPKYYKKMNPPNGWGDYEGAVKFLENIKQACIDHPACSVNVSY